MERIRLTWLGLFLLAAGLLCTAVALVPEPVLKSLISTDTGTRAAVVVPWLKSIAFYPAVVLCILGLCAWAVSSRPDSSLAFSRLLSARPEPSTLFPLQASILWFVYCGVLVFGLNLTMLQWGFFHADDFELLAMARAIPLQESIWITHGIHTMPLMRIEASLLRLFFGCDAFYYNLLNLLLFTFSFTAIALVLHELGTRTLATVSAVTLCACHATWSVVTTGYYLQNVYLQGTLCSLLAVFFYFRWKGACRAGWFVAMTICTVLGCFTDLAGLWVPPAIAAFVVLHEWGRNVRLREQWPLLLMLTLVFAAGAAFNAVVYIGYGEFLPPAGAPVSRLGRLLSLWYFFSGSLGLSWVCPLYYHILHLKGLLIPALVGMTCLWGVALGWFFKAADNPRRWSVVGVLLVLFGAGVMVVLGRDFEFLRFQGALFTWPAKYISNVLPWCAVLFGLLFDRALSSPVRLRQIFVAQLLLVAMTLVPLLHWVAAEAGIYADYNYGRSSILSMRIRERQTLTELRSLFTWLSDARGEDGGPLYLPTVPAFRLQDKYLIEKGIVPDAFLPGYDLSFYRDFIFPPGADVVLLRSPMMNSSMAADVQFVDDLRAQVSPRFLEELQQNPKLKLLYEQWDKKIPFIGDTYDDPVAQQPAPDKPADASLGQSTAP